MIKCEENESRNDACVCVCVCVLSMKKDLWMRTGAEHGRQTEKSVSDVIIPHSRERVKLQHTVCFTPLCLCVCVRVRIYNMY